ncbi:MAG: serine protease [Sandaracinaceae bacterium]|jgi:S1-C subfamily serine protease|nr:serine protease [Sandaracinaceae bacterium]
MDRKVGPALLGLVAAMLASVSSVLVLSPTHAQEGADLVALHETAVYGMAVVRFRGGLGSGWLLAQDEGVRPVLVTNAHVAIRVGATLEAELYGGAGQAAPSVRCRVAYVSRGIDFAVAALLDDPPPSARPLRLEPGDVRRGERVILAGNPSPLTFQTTEGVVTGVTPDETRTDGMCGRSRNCLVVDAASFSGSSGGPAINRSGRVVGMLWGGPTAVVEGAGRRPTGIVANASFAYLLHVRAIEAELAAIRASAREGQSAD